VVAVHKFPHPFDNEAGDFLDFLRVVDNEPFDQLAVAPGRCRATSRRASIVSFPTGSGWYFRIERRLFR
jgi:hypothetical protein